MAQLILRRRIVAPVISTPAAKTEVKTEEKHAVGLTTQTILERAKTRAIKPTSDDSALTRARQTDTAKGVIEQHLKLISEAEKQIDEAQRNIAHSYKVVEAQLRLVNLREHSDGVKRAEIEEVWSRQGRKVDPKKFRNKVSNEVFWSSIKVNIESASEHLTDKELNEIADIVPSVKTGERLVVNDITKTVRRSKK